MIPNNVSTPALWPNCAIPTLSMAVIHRTCTTWISIVDVNLVHRGTLKLEIGAVSDMLTTGRISREFGVKLVWIPCLDLSSKSSWWTYRENVCVLIFCLLYVDASAVSMQLTRCVTIASFYRKVPFAERLGFEAWKFRPIICRKFDLALATSQCFSIKILIAT